MAVIPQELVWLAHVLGDPANELCILGEGNVSCLAAEQDSIWVKGSGQQMQEIQAEGFAHVKLSGVCTGLTQSLDDALCRQLLNRATIDGHNPSTETFMHAWLLLETGAFFVAHSHPVPLLSLLCTTAAEDLATKRIFPDEIVCCGPASCFIPYVAPGLLLAQIIQERASIFKNNFGSWPKTYWLQNHGLICTGATAKEAAAASLMTVKVAKVLLGALATGQDLVFLSKGSIDQIYRWEDEHARQRMIFGEQR